MLRQFAAPLTAAARDGLNKGLAALVWTLVVLGLGVTGLGLLLATAVMGLSRLVGPLLSCGLIGLGLVAMALLIAALQRSRPTVPPQPPTPTPMPDPEQIAFALGFVLARVISAKRR